MPVEAWRRPFAAVGRYAAHREPRAAIANTVALVVASNQPFYPLYVGWLVSPVIWPSFLTFLSTPLFVAVPLAMRRDSRLGRSLLLFAGIGNTLLCRLAFGAGSGVEVFLLPCLMLAMLLFAGRERVLALGFGALCFAAYAVPVAAVMAPLHFYRIEDYAALERLNLLSAASLTALIGWLFARASPDLPPQEETETGRRA